MRIVQRAIFVAIVLSVLFVGLWGRPVQAQEGDEIQYNDPVVVTLSTGETVTRVFLALAGDSVEIRLSRLAQYTYTAVLLDPNQTATPLTPGPDGNVIFPIQSVPLSGRYSLVVQATDGSGEMLIQVNSSAAAPEPLAFGETTVEVSTTALRFSLDPLTGIPETMLSLDTESAPGVPRASLPGFTLANGESGETVLEVLPGVFPSVSVILPAQTSFLLTLQPGPLAQQVVINWNQAPSLEEGAPALPTATPVVSGSGPCQVFFQGAVNIRSGPGLEWDPPIGQVLAGTTLPVTGHNGSYSWYQVNYNGQPGWVSGQIAATEVQGDCSGVPIASYPPPPPTPVVVPGGPTATPILTAPAPGGPTPTQPAPPPGGPTPTPTATPTSESPIAPPDGGSNGVLNVPLDGQAALGDVVSYPGGDTEDVVPYDVSGLNSNSSLPGGRAELQIDLICSGTGSEYIQFVIDGANYACGQRFTRIVNAESKTGAIRIRATGGTATYVQWQVVGHAPRLN